MKHITLFVLFALSMAAQHKHSHGAHVHGAAKLGLAMEGTKGEIDFEAPADSIFGFEHVAKTAADKAREKAGLEKLRTRIADMVRFPAAATCRITPKELHVDREGGHADVHGEFTVACAKVPDANAISFRFRQHFPALQEVDVQMTTDSGQRGMKVKQ
jgi:hypothetical protein